MLRRLILALSLSTAIVAVDVQPAQAMPTFVAGVAAFAATPLGGALVSAVVGIGFQFLGSFLTRKATPLGEPPAAIRGAVSTGGVGPIAFSLGYTATAGSLAYRGSWGAVGDTPNAYYTELRILSDLPEPTAPAKLWVDEKRVTPRWDWAAAAQGYPIEEFRLDGVDYAWVRYLNGTQTAADTFMRAKFGARTDAPFTSTMVGTGQSIIIVTYRLKPDLWRRGFPSLKVETEGVALYNVALDTTAGGAGAHRRTDPSTWAPTRNFVVHAYNALMGLKLEDEWVWGGQNLPAARQPAASWIAAINEAAAATAIAGGGTEPQFWGGLEVTGETEPADVIETILLGATGRIAEVGGIYKVLVGAPAAPVLTFDDGHVLATRPGAFTPFPRLEETQNGIQGSYVEPAIGWDWKDPPAIYAPALEAEDGDRRLALEQHYQAIHSSTVVQRVMEAAAKESRRWRRHREWLGPEASDLEPLDSVAWTSARNGYVDKHFLVTEVNDDPAFLVELGLQELDPSDYDPSADPEPVTLVPVAIDRPASQAMTGWTAVADTFNDASGNARRPTIRVGAAAGLDDVERVWVQARVKATEAVVFDSDQSRYSAPYTWKLDAQFLPSTVYQARGRYVPRSSRATDWSAWLDVTTPDVRLQDADLSDVLQHFLDFTSLTIASFNDELARLARIVVEQDGVNLVDKREIEVVLRDQAGDILGTAAVLDALVATVTALDGVVTATAEAVTIVEASVGEVSASGLMRLQAVASGSVGWSRFAIMLRASVGNSFVESGFYLEVYTDGTSRVVLKADKQYFVDNLGNLLAMFSADGASFNKAYIKDLDAVNITAAKIDAGLILQNGTTITGLIAANAVNGWAGSKGSTGTYSGASNQVLHTYVHTPNGGACLVMSTFMARVTTTGTETVNFYLKRDGVTVDWLPLILDDIPASTVALSYMDNSPGTAAVTWTVEMSPTTGSQTKEWSAVPIWVLNGKR